MIKKKKKMLLLILVNKNVVRVVGWWMHVPVLRIDGRLWIIYYFL